MGIPVMVTWLSSDIEATSQFQLFKTITAVYWFTRTLYNLTREAKNQTRRKKAKMQLE